MDLLLSLSCGALGGLAFGGVLSLRRIGQVLATVTGLVGGGLAALALDRIGIGLAHAPAPGGALDPTALAIQVSATFGAGAVVVVCLSKLRRLRRR